MFAVVQFLLVDAESLDSLNTSAALASDIEFPFVPDPLSQDACSGAAPVASIGRSPIVPPARPSAARGVRHRICVRAGAAMPRRARVLPPSRR